MDRIRQKIVRRKRRRQHVRKRVLGTAQRPRLTVFRSLKNIYAQIIADSTGRTLASASSRDKDLRESVEWGGGGGVRPQRISIPRPGQGVGGRGARGRVEILAGRPV